MRKLLVFAMALTLVGSAMAIDLGNQAPTVKERVQYNEPAGASRQGGDTILDAVMVTLPVVNGTGTTVGYMDDYDEVCPYIGSTSPDVVYSFMGDGQGVDIDLFGSAYDTKVYVYDESLALIACNDDFYSDWTSKIENMPTAAGVLYYVVVDGYGGSAGTYLINIDFYIPCVLDCPGGAAYEGEPPLAINYEDTYNGGCNSDPAAPPFQVIDTEFFCGVSGWYLFGGSQYRDTDWFWVTIPEGGVLEVMGDAEMALYLFELSPQDCGAVAVAQSVQVGPCIEGTMTVTGAAGSLVWLWAGPTVYADPAGNDVAEFDYVLFTNLEPVATQNHTWTGVKALFE
jgi:hypothetical protein